MRKTTVLFIALFIASAAAFSQGVGINENQSQPHNSAMLDVSSPNKGMLIPRMTAAKRNSIANPANGLMVFQTDAPIGFYYFDGAWKHLVASAEADPVFSASPAGTITNTKISQWNTAHSWGDPAGLYRSLAYVPAWGEITSKPTFSAVATSGNYNDLSNKPVLFDGAFSSVGSKPTTVAGYGITDLMSTAHPANALTTAKIASFDSMYNWGNYATANYATSFFRPGANELVSYDGTNWVAKTIRFGSIGGGGAIDNYQPTLVLNYCIALAGIFPTSATLEPFLGEIALFSFNFAPRLWAQCNGQLLSINVNTALFSLLGTTYGGDGRVNFALPDLRGRVLACTGSELTMGDRTGSATITFTPNNLPAHYHIIILE